MQQKINFQKIELEKLHFYIDLCNFCEYNNLGGGIHERESDSSL